MVLKVFDLTTNLEIPIGSLVKTPKGQKYILVGTKPTFAGGVVRMALQGRQGYVEEYSPDLIGAYLKDV